METRVNGRAIEDYKDFEVRETGLAVPKAEPLYVPAVANGYRPDDFVLDANLVLYLPLYLLKGSKFKSVDRYQHTATAVGAAWRPNGRYFDKLDNLITIPAHAAIENIFDGGGTFIAWINPGSDGENHGGIIANMGAIFNPWGFSTTDEDTGFVKIRFYFRWTGTDYGPKTATAIVPIDTWSQIAITYDIDLTTNTAIFYLNGVASALSVATPTGTRESGAGENLAIGNIVAANRCFDGLLGELWEYTSLLPAAAILHNYNTTVWRYQ